MRRDDLAHILRAAATIAEDDDIVVIGSQAILGFAAESNLPPEATMSMEADIAFLTDATEAKSDRVDGAIGEGSLFHQANGYYAQGVGIDTAVLPSGWQQRAVAFTHGDHGTARAVCLEPHDLAVSKLVAGREKDITFVEALVAAELVQCHTLRQRVQALQVPPPQARRVLHLVARFESTA